MINLLILSTFQIKESISVSYNVNTMELDDIKLRTSTGTEKKLSAKSKKRILECAELVRNGYSRSKIIEHLTDENGENLGRCQAGEIYKATMQYLTPSEEEAAHLRTEIIETLREVISQGMKNGDKTATVKALDILNKMSGQYTEKIEAAVSGNMNFGFKFDIDSPEDSEEDGEE